MLRLGCSSVRTVPVDEEDEDVVELHQEAVEADEPLEMVESMREFDAVVASAVGWLSVGDSSLLDACRCSCGMRLGVAGAGAGAGGAELCSHAVAAAVDTCCVTAGVSAVAAAGVAAAVCSGRGISDVLEADFMGCA